LKNVGNAMSKGAIDMKLLR